MKNNIVNGTVSITVNRVITYVISYNYAKIEVDLHDSLPQKKKTMTILTELRFLKELVLIRQANQNSEIYVTIGIF